MSHLLPQSTTCNTFVRFQRIPSVIHTIRVEFLVALGYSGLGVYDDGRAEKLHGSLQVGKNGSGDQQVAQNGRGNRVGRY